MASSQAYHASPVMANNPSPILTSHPLKHCAPPRCQPKPMTTSAQNDRLNFIWRVGLRNIFKTWRVFLWRCVLRIWRKTDSADLKKYYSNMAAKPKYAWCYISLHDRYNFKNRKSLYKPPTSFQVSDFPSVRNWWDVDKGTEIELT